MIIKLTSAGLKPINESKNKLFESKVSDTVSRYLNRGVLKNLDSEDFNRIMLIIDSFINRSSNGFNISRTHTLASGLGEYTLDFDLDFKLDDKDTVINFTNNLKHEFGGNNFFNIERMPGNDNLHISCTYDKIDLKEEINLSQKYKYISNIHVYCDAYITNTNHDEDGYGETRLTVTIQPTVLDRRGNSYR